MTSQFSPKVSEILAYSREEAARLASRSVAPEHLLLGLLRMKDGPVVDVFRRLNISVPTIKKELEDRVRESEMGQPINTSELVLNEKASNILKLAVLEARIQHLQRVDEQHLLLAILHDNVSNGAKEILEANDMTYDDVYALLQQKNNANDGIGLPDEEDYDEVERGDKSGARQQQNQQTATQARKPAGKSGASQRIWRGGGTHDKDIRPEGNSTRGRIAAAVEIEQNAVGCKIHHNSQMLPATLVGGVRQRAHGTVIQAVGKLPTGHRLPGR